MAHASVNEINSAIIYTQGGSTALLYAAMKGHLAVVKQLLSAGARDIPNKVH